MTEEIDFTHVETARINQPGSPLHGVTGRVAAVIFAYPGWPCDLLYLTLNEGDYAGRTIPIRADLCEVLEVEAVG